MKSKYASSSTPLRRQKHQRLSLVDFNDIKEAIDANWDRARVIEHFNISRATYSRINGCSDYTLYKELVNKHHSNRLVELQARQRRQMQLLKSNTFNPPMTPSALRAIITILEESARSLKKQYAVLTGHAYDAPKPTTQRELPPPHKPTTLRLSILKRLGMK